MKTSFCPGFQPISLKDVLSQCIPCLLHRRINIELLGKRLVILEKICYHTRVKSEGESGVSRHSPDPPQPAWTRVERIQHIAVY